MNIKLELSVDELSYILKVLNNLPTETNVWPLVQRIKQQVEASQAPQAEATPE